MLTRKTVVIGAAVVVVALLAVFGWKHLHEGHAHHGEAAVLSLNDGQRWATDEPLRTGMQRIRDAATPVLAAVAAERLSVQDAKAFYETVEKNFRDMAEHCKLPPKADATLHALVADLLRGAALLQSDPRSREAASTIAKALRQYPEYFLHEGWTPVTDLKA